MPCAGLGHHTREKLGKNGKPKIEMRNYVGLMVVIVVLVMVSVSVPGVFQALVF